jgi:hypothetical protein
MNFSIDHKDHFLLKQNDSSTGRGIKKLSHLRSDDAIMEFVKDYLLNKVYVDKDPVKIMNINKKNLSHGKYNFFIQTLYESPFELFEKVGGTTHRVRCKLRFYWSPILINYEDTSKGIDNKKLIGAMIYKIPNFEYYLDNTDISNEGYKNNGVSDYNKRQIEYFFNKYIKSKEGKKMIKKYATILSRLIPRGQVDLAKRNQFLFAMNAIDVMMTGQENRVTGLSILETNPSPVFLGDPDFVSGLIQNYVFVTGSLTKHGKYNSLDNVNMDYQEWYIQIKKYKSHTPTGK